MTTLIALKLAAIVAVIALGYAAGRGRWLGDAQAAQVINHAAFYIFVPALLFRTTSRIDFTALPWGLLAVFFGPVAGVLVGLYAWQRWRQRHRAHTLPVAAPGVRALAATFGNTVQMGIPMATAMFGEPGLALHLAVVSLHALTLLTLSTAFVEMDLAREQARGQATPLSRMLWATARHTVIHPVVLPIVLGLVWNALGLPVPGLLDEILQMLGQAVVPLCLVLIGLSLAQYGLSGAWRGALSITLVKLVLLPGLVLAVGHGLLGWSGLPLAVVVMAAALPVGNNPLLFAQRYRVQEGETTAAIVLSTLLFALTAPMWLALLKTMAP